MTDRFPQVTVVGGGIAGLTATITAAQAGAPVRLLEARAELGGRARTTPPPYRANLGPHALYTDGAAWRWLEQQGLLPPTVARGAERLVYLRGGELSPTPPPALSGALRTILARPAPADQSFRGWALPLVGAEATELLAGLAFIVTFDHDAGRLSAAFTHERLRRVVQPDLVRYMVGGWHRLIEQLATRAAQLGVVIETRRTARTLPPRPVVVATSPAAAQKLVSVANPTELSRVALMDLALTRDLGIPAGVLDLDERMYLARYTAFDRTLAPPGEELVQIACASPPGETSSGARTRIERVLDRLAGDWRRQLRWSRHSLQAGATGALDLPGRDWRARPPIVHDDGVFIAGDYVAAPGLLSEVSFASGREAGAAAAAWALQPPGTLQHDLPRTARPRLTLERDHEPAVRGGITR